MYHSSIEASQSDAARQLGTNLRELRVARMLTQTELAELSRVGRVTIARIENGHNVPQMRTVRALSAALDVDPEELVGEPASVWTKRTGRTARPDSTLDPRLELSSGADDRPQDEPSAEDE